MFRTLWFLTALLALPACPPPLNTPDGGDDNTLVVGPTGGLFIRNGYGLEVPPGAFDQEQRIFVTIFDTGIPEVPMRSRISYGYRLSPASLVPKSPLTLYLPWLEERVPGGVDRGAFDMRRQVGSEAYLALPGSRTNTIPFEAVEAKTDKLGVFWVTSNSQPTVSRLELTPEEASLNVGGTAQFEARVVSPTGETIEVPVTWTVIPARVARVDSNGLVTALDPGIATLKATSGLQSRTASIYVQGTTVGPATYAHENPFPTGNDLFGGTLALGNFGTVYAGNNGTVLVEDGLGAWTRAFSRPGLTLKAAAGTSLNDAIAIGQLKGAGVLVEFKGAMAPAMRVFQPTQISDLSHLWFDGTHGMAVGEGNEVLIRRNGQWTTEYHPSFEALLSVIGDGAGGFVVVGDLGSIYKWDPVRLVWDSLYDTRLSVKLEAAQLVDASGQAWAAGGNRLWHFIGSGWVAESLPATPAMSKVTALGLFDSRVVVGGEARISSGQPLPASKGLLWVRHQPVSSDGGVGAPSWTNFPLRGLQVVRGIFGGGSTSPVGRVVGDLGAVWAWNSTMANFTERSTGFQGDVADLAVTDTDVFATVNECTDIRCLTRSGTVMHRTATGFQPLGSFPPTEQVYAVTARTDSEVIASTATGLYRWDGTGWFPLPVADLSDPILDLAWCGTQLWGAGSDGSVYKGDTNGMNSLGSISGDPLTSIHCPKEGEVWVAGNEFIASRATQGIWTARRSQSVSQAPWMTVWSPGLGEAFVFGDARFGAYWDTSTLLLQDATGPVSIDVSTAMWGNKIDNLYMTGLSTLPVALGFMLRFDGINWSQVDSGACRKGTALIGRSTHEIWLGTTGGGILKAVSPN